MNNAQMKRGILFLATFLVVFFTAIAGYTQSDTISAVSSTDADYMVRNVFLGGGNCFQVFNVQLRGEVGQAGIFSNGAASIGFDRGIILSNGNVEGISGPNDLYNFDTNLSTGYGNSASDPDIVTLSALEGDAGLSFADVVVLEFDFIPTLDSISFDFVFASEEYCEFTLSTFIDLFGFFISGPGINGPYTNNGINIAVVPNTNQAITARSVSAIFNSQYYRNNIPPGNLGCSLGQPAFAPDFIGFDGFTVPLKASTRVIPCETYHIKMVVSDRGNDDKLDAAVFLEANSFAVGRTATIAGVVNGASIGNDSPYEGCGSVSVIFGRGDTISLNELVIRYDILPSSTATPGVDFTAFPDSIVLPPGVLWDTVEVAFLADNIPEGNEFFTIKLANPCDCSQSSLTINVLDAPTLGGTILGPDKICTGDGLELAAVPTGGYGAISYRWPNGDQDSLFNIVPLISDSYQLILSDECNNRDTLSFTVPIQAPTSVLAGNEIVCDGRPPVSLPIVLRDGQNFSFDLFIDNVPTRYENIPGDTLWIPVTETGVFEVGNLMADGCPGESTGFAQVQAVQITTTAQIDSLTCFGDTDAIISVLPIGGSGMYAYQWAHDNTVSGRIAADLTPGTYTTFIQDSNGCLDTISVLVTQPTLLEMGIDTLDLLANCLGGGTLQGLASGGTAPYTFSWSNNVTTALNPDLPAANYTLTVQDANGCNFSQMTSILADSLLPVVNIQALDSLDCATSLIQLDASGSSQAGNLTYQWVDAANNPLAPADPLLLPVSAAGVYTLTISNADNGCSNSSSIVVENFATGQVLNIATPDLLTCDQTSAELTVTNPQANWATEWRQVASSQVVATNVWTYTATTAGDYEVMATDPSTGCTASAIVTVVPNQTPPELAPINTPDTLNCLVNQVPLAANVMSGSGSYSFQWSGPAGGIAGNAQQANVNVLEPGTYQLILADLSNGCQDTLSTVVRRDVSALVINPLPDTSLTCTRDLLNLTATSPNAGNHVYVWLAPDNTTISNTSTVQITQPGTYQVSVTDTDNNCTGTSLLLVSQDTLRPAITIEPNENIDCAVSAVTLSAIPGPANYTPSWTDAQGNPVNAGQWSLLASAGGTYEIAVLDTNNGCGNTANFQVAVDTMAPAATILPPVELTCSVLTTNLQAQVSMGTGAYTYAWSGPAGGLTGPVDGTMATAVASGNYQLIVTDASNQCTTLLSSTVVADQTSPSLDLLPDTLLNCYQPTIQLLGTSSNTGNLAYSWRNATGLEISPTATLSVNTGGLYYLVLTNTDNGCTDQISVAVAADLAPPLADAGAPAIIRCGENQATLNGVITDPSWLPTWYNAASAELSASWSLVANQVGTYELQVFNPANGCSASDQVVVSLDQNAPVANAGNDVFLDCFTGTALIDGSGSSQGSNLVYRLLDANGALISQGSSPNFSVGTAGTYELVVSNPTNNCATSDLVVVTSDLPEIKRVDTQDIACTASTGSLSISSVSGGLPPYLYSVDGGNTWVADNTFANLPASNYNLLVQDMNGCEAAASASIIAADGVTLVLPERVTLKIGDTYQLQPELNRDRSELATFNWSASTQLSCTDCLTPVFTARQTEYLTFTVTDTNGCPATARVLMLVDERIPVYIPNAFSPYDQDGHNDVFYVFGDPTQVLEVLQFQIFDRWGNQLFTRQNILPNDPTQGWDGTWNNRPLNPGIFVYWVEVRLANGEDVILRGDVFLMR